MDAIFDTLSFPWYIEASLVVLFVIAISVFGLLFVRRKIHINVLKGNHEVAGFTFGIIGLIYGVLLGFTVVNVQTRFNEVEKIVETEANLLLDLYRDSNMFSSTMKEAINEDLHNYTKEVIEIEWKAMAQHQELSLRSPKVLLKLWNDFYKINPSTDAERAWYELSINKLNELNNVRLMRLYNSSESLGSMMWTLLIVMAFVTIIFMYFFGADSLHSQVLMTGLLAGCISFMLFLIHDLDTVYMGSTRVYPTPFENVLNIIDEWESHRS